MTEIREELEEHFANLADAEQTNLKDVEEQGFSSSDKIFSDDNTEQFLEAPESFRDEITKTFSDLPLEWRRFLCAREAEIAKGFGDLHSKTGTYKWLEDIYSSRVEELQKHGVKSADDWLKNMVKIDAMLSQTPEDTIKFLADSYGVKLSQNISSPQYQANKQSLSQQIGNQMINLELSSFINEQDEQGNLKHPFYGEVVRDMYDLLNKGVVSNIKDAYDTAIWFNDSVRNKLIAQRTQESLALKSKNAQKSKEAGFSPKGKAQASKKDLSLREELEMRFAEFGSDE